LSTEEEILKFVNASTQYHETNRFFRNEDDFEELSYQTIFLQHIRFRVVVALEDRTAIPSIMLRL